MKRYLIAIAVWVVATAASVCGQEAGGKALPRTTPESQGVSSAVVREFIETADKRITTMHSFMLLRNGKVVSECWWKPYSAEKTHELWSVSKSYTSTAVGLAVDEGKLSIDDEVLKFFPDDAPKDPSPHLKSMRIRDLLTMSTGHETEPRFSAETPWVQTFLNHPVKFKPGTHFLYNTPATHMCSAIVQKVTGKTVLQYLRGKLFEPLGIDGAKWNDSPQGVTLGGWGLNVRTEDIAKLGQLYLQKGEWNGKRILSARWVEMATAKQTSNGSNPKSDWDQGYGFQFWRSRYGAFRGDGMFGQFCIVLPEQQAVIAITAATRDMQGQLNVIWEKLLPAFQGSKLPENPEELRKLTAVQSSLSARDPEMKMPKLPETKKSATMRE